MTYGSEASGMQDWRRRRGLALDVLVAVVSGWIAWAGWHRGVRAIWFAPADGMPGFQSTHYSGGWILLSTVLAVVAVAAVIDLVRRLTTH